VSASFIEHIFISDLTAWEGNAQTHPASQVRQIAKSIQEFGWTAPVLIDETNTVLAGHGRVMAARYLGMDTVPCLRIAGLTQDQKRAYVLADNQLTKNGVWDLDILREEIRALQVMDFDLDAVGFDEAAIRKAFSEGQDDDGDEDREQQENSRDNGHELLIVSTDAGLIAEIKGRIGVPQETNRVSANDVLRMIRGY
jgi:ParB-like chromosome segregation protein Spo0J